MPFLKDGKSPNKTVSNTSSQSSEYCIENARQELECISLSRQIQSTKERRKKKQEDHDEISNYYKIKLEREIADVNRILEDRKTSTYISETVKLLYKDSLLPAPYVLRKQVEIIKNTRKKDLLDIYIRKIEKHNKEMIGNMKKRILNLIISLIVLKTKKHATKKQIEMIQLIQKEMVQLVIYLRSKQLSIQIPHQTTIPLQKT